MLALMLSSVWLGWLVTSAVASQTAYLRPDIDVGAGGNWAVVGASSRWSALNDVVTENQTPDTTDYITNSSGGGGGTDSEVGVTTFPLGNAAITGAKAWFYTPNSNSLTARVKDASGTVLASQLFSSTGWHSLSVTLNGSQTQLDGLRLNFRKESGASSRIVYAAFLKLGLELPASQRFLHFGINANSRSGKPPGAVQDVVAETGATHLREDLEWQVVEPTDNEWDWESTDRLFREAGERGMTILPILDAPPCWAVPPGTQTNLCEQTYPEDDADFADFTAHAVARYGIEGGFWQEHPTLDESLAPKYFEVWNEPYISEFTNGEVNPGRYADLYAVAVAAGRLANPNSKYLVEATWAVNPGPINWAGAMYEHEPSIGVYVDGIAIHPYPGNRDPFHEPGVGIDASFRNTNRIYKYWRDELGINKPMWITEVGYSSCADGAEECVPGDSQAEREELKAEWLADLFDIVDRGEYGYVHAVYLYNLTQTVSPEEPNNKKSSWFGIAGPGGPLPAWTSFASAVSVYDGTPVPNTSIVNKSFSGGGDATFSFTVTDPTSTLECQLDSGAWTVCTSPKTYSKVGSGHAFRVRGTNTEATETTPAAYSW
jgi:hypothetical protein